MASREIPLSRQIDAVINECGTAAGPDLGKLKSILTRFRTVAQSIESGEFFAESNAEVDRLKTLLSDLQKMHTAELENLDAMHKAELEKNQSEPNMLSSLIESVQPAIDRLERQKELRLEEELESVRLKLVVAQQEIERLHSEPPESEKDSAIKQLKKEKLGLELDLETAALTIGRQTDDIARLQEDAKPEKRLPEKEEQVLGFLKPLHIKRVDVFEVAIGCGTSVDKADAILKRLVNLGFAHRRHFNGKYRWNRLDEGGDYLYRHGLLSDEIDDLL